jgi:hypothetical protein
MDFLNSIRDSVETSVTLEFFDSKEVSCYHHIFKSELVNFDFKDVENMLNFDTKRLSQNPYPKNNRPRGEKDLASIDYHRQRIKDLGRTEPIWVLKDGKDMILLDGAHRIVSTFLERHKSIKAYVVEM